MADVMHTPPDCTWWQTQLTITVTIELGKLAHSNPSVNVTTQRGLDGSTVTALVVDAATDTESPKLTPSLLRVCLYGEIAAGKPQWAKLPNCTGLRIVLAKSKAEMWPRLSSLPRDPAHVKVDWSRFSAADDEDEEEDYDAYLRSRYGVTSDWRGPGSGDPPPVLGGRTPGQEHEDFELAGPEMEFENTNEAEAVSEIAPQLSLACLGFAVLRFSQLLAGIAPLAGLVQGLLPESLGTADVPMEAAVYPMACTVAVLSSFLDVGLAAAGATVEGPTIAVFACWAKRAFISLTILTFEAQWPSRAVTLFGVVNARLVSGLLMIIMWITWKSMVCMQDLLITLQGIKTADMSAWLIGSHGYDGRVALLAMEAVAEAACVTTHVVLLPKGVRFLNLEGPWFVAATAFVWLSVCNLIVWQASGRMRTLKKSV